MEEEIHEIRTMREDLYSSGDERSEESDSDEDDDVDALQRKLHLLEQDNARLEVSDVTSHSPSFLLMVTSIEGVSLLIFRNKARISARKSIKRCKTV